MIDFDKFGGTTQQNAWFDQALADLLYEWDHPTLECDVDVTWETQEILVALDPTHADGDTIFAYTEIDETGENANLRIWDGLDTNTGRYSGQDFYMETVAHEIGHVVAGILTRYQPDLPALFAPLVTGTGTWTGGEWPERLLESFAEIFKDVFLPSRKFDNRTRHKLIAATFNDYLALVNGSFLRYTAPHIDYNVELNEFFRALPEGLWGDPFVANVGYPFFWGTQGEPGNPEDFPEGITGGTFTPPADRTGMTSAVLDFDLTMAPDFGVDYATNDDITNPPPPDPEYNADHDPATFEYVGWGPGWWNSDFGIGGDPSGYNLLRGRRVRNELFGYATTIAIHSGGTFEASALGGPLFFIRWELVNPLLYLSEEEAAAAQTLLDEQYAHFEVLAGQVPQWDGAIPTPPDLTTLGFAADAPVRLRIGTSAIADVTQLVADVETTVNGGGLGDTRPAGPGVTEEWFGREFAVLFSFRFPDPTWPYRTATAMAAAGPPARVRHRNRVLAA